MKAWLWCVLVCAGLAIRSYGADGGALLLSGDFVVHSSVVAVGSPAGQKPAVRVIDRDTGELRATIQPEASSFTGGVRVAVGDVNGDGWDDVITAAGPGGGPHVKVFSGASDFATTLADFAAFPANYTGGVFLAAGDVDTDGKDDILAGPGGAGDGTDALLYSGSSVISGNAAVLHTYPTSSAPFSQGMRVAMGDITKDGIPDVLLGAGKSGMGDQVLGFDGPSESEITHANFGAIGKGLNVAMGNLDGMLGDDLIYGRGPGVPALVTCFSSTTGTDGKLILLRHFQPYPNFTGGVLVASGDLKGDGNAELVVGRQTGNSKTLFYEGAKIQPVKIGQKYRPGGVTVPGKLSIALADFNGDGISDCILGDTASGRVKVIDGVTGARLRNAVAFGGSFTGGVAVAAGDVNHDGSPEIICGMQKGGSGVKALGDGSVLLAFQAFDSSFTGGVRVAAGDVNGDGFDDIIVAQGPGGGLVRVFDGKNANQIASFNAFDAQFTGGVNVAAGDVNGDGNAEVIVAQISGTPLIRVLSGTTGTQLSAFTVFPDGFTGPVSVSALDVDGNGQDEILVSANLNDPTIPQVRIFSPFRGQIGSLTAFNSLMTSPVKVVAGFIMDSSEPSILVLPQNGGSGRIFPGTEEEIHQAGIIGWFKYRPDFARWGSVAVSPR